MKLDLYALLKPADGCEAVQMTGTEDYVFHRSDESTRNVVVDADTVAYILGGLARGYRREDFAHLGLGVFWDFEEVSSADDL